MADDYEKGYDHGYADGHAEGFTAGSLARHGAPDNLRFTDPRTAWYLSCALLDLEDENARLIAKLRGYVLVGSAKGPGVLVRHDTATARGLNREAYKPQHRYPFVLGPDGAWKRAKGRLRIEDWAMRLPPESLRSLRVGVMPGHARPAAVPRYTENVASMSS
jgi:hypothetical protein